jgi:hypothetical protein
VLANLLLSVRVPGVIVVVILFYRCFAHGSINFLDGSINVVRGAFAIVPFERRARVEE